MKAILILAVTFAVCNAGFIPAAISTGHSTQSRSQDGLGNYNFAYNEQHATGGSSRSESGNALGQVVGSYSLGVVDGRQRVVNYVADGLGFRASIATNEPGTKAQAAAATSISAPGLVAAAPAVVAAPAVATAHYAAPAVATAHYAAPAIATAHYAAPAVVAAPAVAKVVAAAPVSHYSTAVNHATAHYAAPAVATAHYAAPAVVAAPAVAKVVAAAPVAHYSTAVNHASHVAHLAGPAYTTTVHHAGLVAPGLDYNNLW